MPQPALLRDTFTAPDGRNLTAHVGETKHWWVRHPLFPSETNNIDIKTGRARCQAVPAVYLAHPILPASPDYDVTARIIPLTLGTATANVAGRMHPTQNTRYYLQLNRTSNVWQLVKTVAGSVTLLGSWAHTFVQNQLYVATLKMRGSKISAIIDGVTRIGPVTDSDIVAPGRIAIGGGNVAGLATGLHFDSVEAANAPAPALGLTGAGPSQGGG